jgi:hypothetical protein
MADSNAISVKEATEELLKTSIFKNIIKRNNKNFAEKLAIWLVRYILIASSMNESLNINLEQILMNLHGERFKQIISLTEKTFNSVKRDTEKYDRYIW